MTEQIELRETPIRAALYRPNLILGGDRRAMIFGLTMSAALIFSAVNRVALVFGILIAIITVTGLRKLARHDPLMGPVYIRFLQYRPFYFPPYSRPARVANSKRGFY